jgi:hypothetical protein
MTRKTTKNAAVPEVPQPPVIVAVALDVKLIESAVFALGWSVGASVERYKKQLNDRAASIARDMEKIERRLANDQHPLDSYSGINSLGELQGSGPELDRLCAQYSQAREVRSNLAKSLNPLFQALIAALPDGEREYVLQDWNEHFNMSTEVNHEQA